MAYSDLREFLAQLRAQKELIAIANPFDATYEISGLLSELDKKGFPAVLFEKVNGSDFTVVGNLLGTRKRLAMALGLAPEKLHEQLLPKMENPIQPLLSNNEAPRKVITDREKIDLRKLFPILTHYAKDSNPYITSGVTSARNPDTGVTARGLHRMEVRGKNTLGIALINPPLADILKRCRQSGKRMELATVIGVDPAVLISVIMKASAVTDKLAIAGGIRGAAVKTVKAVTVDVDIPADAEIVIEGYIDPQAEEPDGVMGESSGYYLSFQKTPLYQVTAVSFREKGFYHGIVPWSVEVDNLLYLVHGLDFIPKMRKEIPGLNKIHFVPRTFGSHVVMSLDAAEKSDVRRALVTALALTNTKKVTLVDADVNVEDNEEVEWAIATRFQADRDLIVIPRLRGQPIDPSSGEGFATAKIGIDATKPRKQGFEKVEIPAEVSRKISPQVNELIRKDSK